jgi:hypothetical protein
LELFFVGEATCVKFKFLNFFDINVGESYLIAISTYKSLHCKIRNTQFMSHLDTNSTQEVTIRAVDTIESFTGFADFFFNNCLEILNTFIAEFFSGEKFATISPYFDTLLMERNSI